MDPRALLMVAWSLTACAPQQEATVAPASTAERAWNLRVFSTRAGEETTFAQVLDAAAQADFVLVGETHTDDQTHRLEQQIVEALAARKPGKVALSLEMFQRDVQPTVDAYLAGTIDEAAFVDGARPWGNYRTGYRPMVEAAKRAGVPVIAANLPRGVQMKFAMQGKAALDALTPEQRAWVPATIHPPQASYWARIEQRLRDAGHGMASKRSDADARRYSVQNLWDNTMAEAAVAAHAAGTTVVHVAGAFHIEYADGIAAQILQRKPDAKIVTITLVPVSDLRIAEPLNERERADFIVYALADGSGINAGHLAVTVPMDLRYRLHAPTAGDDPRPLLVWLDWDGGSTRAALQLWSIALGPDVLVAAVEPPYRELAPDLRTTGRWAWPDTYAADQGRVVDGVESIVAYLSDRWAVDPKRIVIAGSGAGGAAALWAGLYGDVPGASVVAVQPDSVTRLGEAGLPSRPATLEHAAVLADPARVKPVTATLKLAGIDATVEAPQEHAVRVQTETWIRRGLGLPPTPEPTGGTTQLAIAAVTPIAWQWGMLHARLRERDGGGRFQVVPATAKGAQLLTVDPAQFEDGRALPLAPGPFGGTTVLVVPSDTTQKRRDAWDELAQRDVIKARSRFARLNVVSEEQLPAALDAIRDAGRRNVLIVPAQFVVGPERMRGLQAATAGHVESLTVSWLPGLGGELARALARPKND